MNFTLIAGDDSDLTLIGIQTILTNHPDWQILAAVRSANELLNCAVCLQPDVILFNLRLDQQMDVLALVERLQHISSYSRLIVLGDLANGLLMRDLLAYGVLGYLFSGDELRERLITALDLVRLNRPYLSPTPNTEYLITMQSPHAHEWLDLEARLVLRLLAQGEHAGQISQRMGIDKRRVYWVREKLRRRFGAKTNEHLIQRASAEGFIYHGD